MVRSNSILSEFLLLFPSVFTLASCVGERDLARDALIDTARFFFVCTLLLHLLLQGKALSYKTCVVLKAI